MTRLNSWMPWARPETYLQTEPYPFGWLDDFLPAEIYTELDAEFVLPDDHEKASMLAMGKKRVLFTTPPMPEGIGELPKPWTDFLTRLSSAETIRQAFDWAKSLTPVDALPPIYQRFFALRNALPVDALYWQCEFSSMKANVLLPPHSDSTDKILIFVHYYAPPGWQSEWGGETEVYRAKRPEQNWNWSNFFLRHSDVETLQKSRFLPNRLFYFVKTPAAWHGVSPLAQATTLPRRSFNFSLRVKPDAALPAGYNELLAEIKATEGGVFGAR